MLLDFMLQCMYVFLHKTALKYLLEGVKLTN